MKIALIIIGFIVVIFLIYFLSYTNRSVYNNDTSPNQPATNEPVSDNSVLVTDFAYNPAELTISKGESATFVNNDPTAHTVTFDNGLDSGTINSGQSWTTIFNDSGTFSYHCSLHPQMTGRIIVQ